MIPRIQSQGAVADIPTRLYPHDYLPYKLFATDGTYAYGLKDGGSAVVGYRLDSSYNETAMASVVTAIATALSIVGFICVGGVLFAQCDDTSGGTGKRFLARSTDLGATWAAVTLTDSTADVYTGGEIGKRISTHSTLITILGDRGMCAATIDGATVLFFGEYNVNASRVAGGANDWVRIWKSTDLGINWTVAMEWNTSGHQMRHCHYIAQDPYYPQYIWVGNGDNPGNGVTTGTAGEGGGGFIRWDVTLAPTWTFNWDYSDSATPLIGFKPSSDYTGALRNREMCTDLIFTEDYIYNPADWGNNSSGPDDIGIWRFDRDMTVYQKVDNSNANLQLHSQYWGLRTSGGTFISTEIKDGTSDHNIYVYTSANGQDWHRSGVVLIDATTGSTTGGFAGLFEWNDKVYMSFSLPALKKAADSICTIVLDPVGKFEDYGPEPEVLSPVFWVSPTGANNTNAFGATLTGYTSRAPWLTPLYALTGSRVGRGARVIIGAGTYTGSGVKDIDPTFKATDLPDAGFECTIEGAGAGVTIIEADSTAAYLFNFKTASFLSRVSDLTCYATREQSGGTGRVTNMQDAVLPEFRRCVIGSTGYNPASNVAAAKGTITLTQCQVYGKDTTANLLTSGGGTGGSILVNSSLVYGGTHSTYHGGISMSGNNNTFVGYKTAGAEITSGATNLPQFRNTVMYSTHASNSYSVIDNRSAGSSYAAVPFDYCYANKTTWITGGVTGAAWAAGVNNVAITASPSPFTSSTDYSIPASSGAYRKGKPTTLKTIDGVKRNNNRRPNIGAYDEYETTH